MLIDVRNTSVKVPGPSYQKQSATLFFAFSDVRTVLFSDRLASFAGIQVMPAFISVFAGPARGKRWPWGSRVGALGARWGALRLTGGGHGDRSPAGWWCDEMLRRGQ